MILLNRKYYIVLLCFFCVQQLVFAQIGNYTKVDKIYRNSYNFLQTNNVRGKQHKDNGLYVVYSDRDDNNAFFDYLGLKQGKKQPFLASYFVIDEKSDFLELVKFDPSIIGKPKGLFSFFYRGKYNFKEVEKVEYIGWIQKENLLHFSHPKISEANLKPLVYYLGINNLETLFDLRKFISKDSISVFKDPTLKIKSKKSFNINQFVYLYKFNSSKTAALVSNLERIQHSDSLERVMGWVPSQLIKNIGQRRVWNAHKQSNVVLQNIDSTKYSLKTKNIKNPFLFQPAQKFKEKPKVLAPIKATVHTPFNIWDHYNNKLINIKGGDVYLREVPKIKKENNVFNFHFIFDCSNALREKLMLQITSLQRIWLLISEDERFAGKQFTFSASSFGCDSYYEFPKSESFALWVDYLQRVFINDGNIKATGINTIGLEKCLLNIINKQIEGGDFENNLVIIAGEENLDLNRINNEELLYDLSRISARLLIFQLENKSDKKHQDYILKAKQVLATIGSHYSDYISNYIIENKQKVKGNHFVSLESDENNIYLLDAPKNSMYTGGLVFPKINKSLSPVSFDVALDSLLSKTIAKNHQLINSLENGSDKLGFLRSQPTQRIVDVIKNDTLKYNPLLIPKINIYERYLETSVLNLSQNEALEPGYLFHKNELEVIIESYKSVIPLINKNVTKKARRALYKKYKSYYKKLNKLLFYKELRRKNTIGELLEIKTGISVSDRLLNTIKIKEICRKSKLSNEQYLDLMQGLRSKIKKLEEIIDTPTTTTYIDGSKKTYYYVSKKSLL